MISEEMNFVKMSSKFRFSSYKFVRKDFVLQSAIFTVLFRTCEKVFSVSRHTSTKWYSLILYDQKFFVQFQIRNLCINITLKTLYFFASHVELQKYDTKTKFIIVFLFVSVRAWVNRNTKKKNWKPDTYYTCTEYEKTRKIIWIDDIH